MITDLFTLYHKASKATVSLEVITEQCNNNPSQWSEPLKQAKAEAYRALSELAIGQAIFQAELNAESHGVKNPYLIAQLVKENLKIENDPDGKPVAHIIVDDMPMGLKDYIQRLKASPDTGFLFKDGNHSLLSGAEPNRPKNPFKKGPDFNLTEQGRILKNNPALAAQLKKEA